MGNCAEDCQNCKLYHSRGYIACVVKDENNRTRSMWHYKNGREKRIKLFKGERGKIFVRFNLWFRLFDKCPAKKPF